MPRDYKNGKTYQLVSDETDFVYVGSTTQQLAKRLYEHKDNAKRCKKTSKLYGTMREVGVDTFRIILIKNFPCESKEQLCAKGYEISNVIWKADSIRLLGYCF